MEKKHRNENKRLFKKISYIVALEIILVIGLLSVYLYFNSRMDKHTQTSNLDKKVVQAEDNTKDNKADNQDNTDTNILSPEKQEELRKEEKRKQEEELRANLIEQADLLALQYEYDAAIELLMGYQGEEGGYDKYDTLKTTVKKYEDTKSSLVRYGGVYKSFVEVNHIFFHSLIADTAKAFDGDYKVNGYNMYMTTVTEFEKMIRKMYEDGYVLVSIHDLTKKVIKEDGSVIFEEGDLFLPEGKKPFVLSQDDVNYYEYMEGDGFASRMIIGEDGKVTCEMKLEDGVKVTGAFDMVPIIDAFVEEHPDFSYRGAKGILAITGYEGALGYRTNDRASVTYDEDKKAVIEVAKALKANGWEFACHSWGHRNIQSVSDSFVMRDTDRWLEEVGSLVGPTDIYIFPYGVDIHEGVSAYRSEKYNILKKRGFDYYCGVYKSPWMQIKKDYVRMTRRPLDGQAMLQFPERLQDLFDVNEILDPARPARGW